MSNNVSFFQALKVGFEVFEKWAATIDWNSVHNNVKYISEQLPKDVETVSIKLMNRGWFVWFYEGYMSDFSKKLGSLINKTDLEQDEYMEGYIKNNICNFKNILLTSYPDRAEQIKGAFESHDTGNYYSSVPSFLVVAEGMGRDIYPRVGIFSKIYKQGDPKTKEILDSISGISVMEEAVLKPLRVKSDVTKTISNPTDFEHKMFNRHLIMHGTSNNYGNEANSLKAISLAYFIHESLTHLSKK